MLDQNGMENQEVHRVAASGNLSDLKNLVSSNKTLIDSNGWFGVKPLHYASRSGNISCVKYLVENGADVNAKCIVNETTPIFETSTLDVARYLVEHGAQLDVVSTKGRVALDYAIQGKHVEVVNYLVNCGVDVNFKKQPDLFNTMLQWTINSLIPSNKDFEEAVEKSLRMLEILLKAGGDPNQRNAYGTTVLHMAVEKKLLSIVKLLLNYNADPCIRDDSGNSCFECTDNKAILALLEPHKANLVEYVKNQDDFESLIERLIATGETTRSEFVPCSEEEIKKLEKTHNVILPEEYKRFLRVMGNGAGSFLKSDHWDAFLPSFGDFLGKHFFEYEDDELEEEPVIPPDNFFVFASRMGDWNLGLIADGTTDDPIIYRIDDEGNIEKAFETIWGFIQEMVEYYEFYLDPKRFTQSNKKVHINTNEEEKKSWWKFWN